MRGGKQLLRILSSSPVIIEAPAMASAAMPRVAATASCTSGSSPARCLARTGPIPSSIRGMASSSKAPRPDLIAFQSRVGLAMPSELIASALPVGSPALAKVSEHERLRILGSNFVQYIVSRHLFAKHPEMAGNVLESAIDGYAGAAAMSSVGRGLGVEKLINWTSMGAQNRFDENVVISKTTYAIIGAAVAKQGAQEARTFVERHILSRTLDYTAHTRLAEPKRILAALLKKNGMEAPVSRLLEESGRLSHAPSFVVGIFSGQNKLGEGVGSSLKMAETRAARAALRARFLKEISSSDAPVEQDLEGLSSEGNLSFLQQ